MIITKSCIKPEADLSKLEKLKNLYDACEVSWKTKTEQITIEASAEIRNCSNWVDKLENEADREQWIADMKEKKSLTDKQAAYVISELFYYKKLQSFVENSGSNANLSIVDMVWYTDIPENSDLAQEFNMALSKMLGTMPKDHYSRKNVDQFFKNMAEQIVDPALYSLVYKSTPILSKPMTYPMEALNLCSFGTVPGSIDAWKQAIRNLNASMAKRNKENGSDQSETAINSFVPFNEEYLGLIDPKERHWLPADIYVNKDGSVDFKSYINNIHPDEHADMYKAIAKILSKTIPLLEQALTDWEHPRDLRIPYDYDNCLEFPIKHPSKLGGKYDIYNTEFDDEVYDEAIDQWRESVINTTPDPENFVEPERPMAAYSLRNKNLQVVVEITDKTEPYFPSTASENIIATAVYFYDIQGRNPCTVEFLDSIYYDKFKVEDGYDVVAHEVLFGICTRDKVGEFTQSAGTIDIPQGRIICYPNIYKQNGYRQYKGLKRLNMHFVDPSVRIVSTAIVPPQQKDWWKKSVSSVPSRISTLPLKIQEMVFTNVDSPMSFEKACECSEKPNGSTFGGYDDDKYIYYVYIGDRNFYEADYAESLG